jgi:hypothetical protein
MYALFLAGWLVAREDDEDLRFKQNHDGSNKTYKNEQRAEVAVKSHSAADS